MYHTMETRYTKHKESDLLLANVSHCVCGFDYDTYVSGSCLLGFKTLQMQLQRKDMGNFFQ